MAETLHGSVTRAAMVAGIGIGLRALFVWSLDKMLPHEHFKTRLEGADPGHIARIWLFVIAITIHNLPEGLSIGVAMAVAVVGLGYSRLKAFVVAAMTGPVEAVGGALGAAAVTVSGQLLAWGLTFAAGAMRYIISDEIVPEPHRNGHQGRATTGLILGLILMMLLDVTLG